jgi:glutamine---fructose-6-phosphate transaminase (isomerizing)
MNKNDSRYNRFHLVSEMYETVEYIKNFTSGDARVLMSLVPENTPMMLTGEGSSRIFPGKNAVHNRLLGNKGPLVLTESATDLSGKVLNNFIVIGASNSGKTREVVNLCRDLKNSGHKDVYGLTCTKNSLLETCTSRTFLVDAGIEKAVAASKSVVAQALFYDAIVRQLQNEKEIDTDKLAMLFEQTLNIGINPSLTEKICKAETVYFTGNNNGVAEELTLKTNEIIRKKSAYLPGTYLLHGVEEVMTAGDVIIMIDSYPGEYEKIRSVYSSIGTTVIAVSTEPSPFHTMIIPAADLGLESYIKLAAGWNLLVEAGITLGINLDKPQRARKIGNEAAG